jgi:hypothetical protein
VTVCGSKLVLLAGCVLALISVHAQEKDSDLNSGTLSF